VTRRVWVRLDNASNIFLAARSDADPKVFRLSAEMDHDVDPRLLQEALDATYDRYRLYHAVLRSGVFWYYLQDSDLRPLVAAEELHSCAPIYQADRRTLLFRVVHYRRRISLEVFHALSDGTGASWFLSDLVTAYVRLRHPEPDHPLSDAGGISDAGPPPGQREPGDQAGDDVAEQARELTADSFTHYFRRRRPRRVPASDSAFGRAAAPAVLTVERAARPSPGARRELGRSRGSPRTKVHRIRGTRTADNRTRVVELTVPTAELLALARAEGVALTMYLTAVFFESVRRSSGGLTKTRTLAASVPVNLRQHFPSTSPRNFFATTRVEHTYRAGDDELGSVCRQLESQFRPKSTPEALEEKLRRFLRFERMPVLRIVPRPLKDVILKLVNHGSNRSLTIAVSNLGRLSLPEPADSHVGRMLFHVSAARPQLSVASHADLLTLSFTSPFIETDHIREFARLLSVSGVEVTVAAERVTETELAEREP
jgi:hypothetical protein